MSKRAKGYDGEYIVKNYYLDNGYEFVESNFTIKGGEIDLIFTKDGKYYFVEVKVVDNIDDLFDYIKNSKIKALERAVVSYVSKFDINAYYQIDFVFVKNGKIYQQYSFDGLG